MRRQVPLLITFVVGMIMLLEAFVPHPPFDEINEKLTTTFNVLTVFAFILGGGNLVKIHLGQIHRKNPGWGYSLVTILGFFFILVVGLFKFGADSFKQPLESTGTWFYLNYEYCLRPLQATMFSLLAFFVASASYRAFRAKNREATILLIAAFTILLGRTLIGTALTDYFPGSLELLLSTLLAFIAKEMYKSKQWVSFVSLSIIIIVVLSRTLYGYSVLLVNEEFNHLTIPSLVNWIMLVPQLAGQRAIMIGICLGIISMSLRIILGVERSYLGTEND